MASDEMKKNLHGVFLETIDEGGRNRLRMVATDGHRLAIADDDMEETASLQLEKGIIIPKNGLNEIRRFIEDAPEEIMIGVCQGMCIIKTSGAVLRVSLVDAEYPDYRRVIPVEKGVIVKVDKNAILSALKRMNVISSERCCGVILTVSDGRMVLESTNPEVGEAKDEIEADHPGTEISVAYNVKYLIDAVGAIDEKEVIFDMTAEMKPGVIRPAENDDYMCMVAPLKN
jgi:DNA polymerase-3 subunit beta